MSNSNQGTLQQIERMHPYHLMLYLSIFSSVLIFGFLIFSFVKTSANESDLVIRLPVFFCFSLFLSVFISVLGLPLGDWFRKERTNLLLPALSVLSSALIVFLLLQYFGWRELAGQGVYFNGNAAQGYIYVVTGAHAFHVLGGLIMLLFAYHKLQAAAAHPVSKLIYYTDEFERMRIQLVVRYLHFLDLVWVVLFFLLFIISK